MLLFIVTTFWLLLSCNQSQSCFMESSLPRGIFGHQTVYDDVSHCVYLFGGQTKSDSSITTIYKRDMDQTDWTTLSVSTPSDSWLYSQNSVLINRIVYMIGMEIYKFDIVSEDWLSNTQLIPPQHPSDMGCVDGNDTHLFIIGGDDSNSIDKTWTDYLQIYNINDNSWIAELIDVPPIKGNGWTRQYCRMADDELYAFGGKVGGDIGWIDNIFKYSALNKWSLLSLTLPSIAGVGVTIFKHPYIYLVGGWNDGDNAVLNTIIEYDTNTESITSTYSMEEGIDSMSAEIVNDKVYIFGGQGSAAFDASINVERCDILQSSVATSRQPSEQPSHNPSSQPSNVPSQPPTGRPTAPPTEKPTAPPTGRPTAPSTGRPTAPPTEQSTAPPTEQPTAPSTGRPTAPPTEQPTAPSTGRPTAPPTEQSTVPPTGRPDAPPTGQPSAPSQEVTAEPDWIEYTIIISHVCDDNECTDNVDDIGNVVLVAFANDDAVLTAEVININQVKVTLTVEDSGISLDTDQIQRDIERELKDNYGDAVKVNIKTDHDHKGGDEEDNDEFTMIHLLYIFAAFACFCVTVFISFTWYTKRLKFRIEEMELQVVKGNTGSVVTKTATMQRTKVIGDYDGEGMDDKEGAGEYANNDVDIVYATKGSVMMTKGTDQVNGTSLIRMEGIANNNDMLDNLKITEEGLYDIGIDEDEEDEQVIATKGANTRGFTSTVNGDGKV